MPTRTPYTNMVQTWLAHNPGFHRPKDVAVALNLPTPKTGTVLLYLAQRGRITRHRNENVRNGPGSSIYSA